ncbi:MAG: KilA-N domain-containing protein [Anaerovoracaceae bacterium]
MDATELVQARLHHTMSMNFFWNLLNNGKLTQSEFERAARFVDEKYDVENINIKLAMLKSENAEFQLPDPKSDITYLSGKMKKASKAEVEFVSLTDIARKFSGAEPSYVVQSWLRSRSTLAFLSLWEKQHNEGFDADGYENLLAQLNTGNFTMTPKQWIAQTKAIGLTSKVGKNGGTYAHPLLACEFMMWLSPEYKLNLLLTAKLLAD